MCFVVTEEVMILKNQLIVFPGAFPAEINQKSVKQFRITAIVDDKQKGNCKKILTEKMMLNTASIYLCIYLSMN